MSYNPTQWKDGDLVTSAKLNKLEQGVAAGGIQIIHCENDILDKTWQEIYDGGFGVVVIEDGEGILYEQIMEISPGGVVTVGRNGPKLIQSYYIASSPDDYPVWSSESSNDESSSDSEEES